MTSNRKIIGPVELVILLIALLLIAYILLKSTGGSVFEQAEEIQIVDNPVSGEGKKQVRNYEMQNEDRVEVILQQLSENYTDEKNTMPKDEINYDKTISEDELNYFEEVKEKHAKKDTSKNPSDWLTILQASHKTYSKIKSVFENADNSGKAVKEDNVSKMLENAIIANNIYSKIEELFQISEEDAKAFAEKGKNAVSDWAEFIEQNQQKNTNGQ